MKRVLLTMVAGLALLSTASAAELQGVTLPERQRVGRTELQLNGIALRTYSILQVPIWVGGLYLMQPETDAGRILRSAEMKLLKIRFVHDVDQEQARDAWRDGFERNCGKPCDLAPLDVERFLAAVPSIRKGDRYVILFTADGAEISANGRLVGRIGNRRFATAMLATFIGPHPPTPRLKRELLGENLRASR
jgi:hypothetical protein